MNEPKPTTSTTSRNVPAKFLVAFSLVGEQSDLVRAIAEAVEARLGSSTVFYYEWYEHYIAGGDGDVRIQQIYSEQCELAVVCVSERYGTKPWTQVEHAAIRARYMKALGSPNENERLSVLPIRVGDGDVKGILINTLVPDVRDWTAEKAVELIVERLRLIAPHLIPGADHPGPELTWPEPPMPLHWPMADHGKVREAFEKLLNPKAQQRYLPVRGPSETGKSHITRQMLANALQMPGLACGRFDFKGTTDMNAEVRAFIQELDVPSPPTDRPLNQRLAQILDELKRRKRPTLLIFDTFEAAGEAKDWVEMQLLPTLIRAGWIRVVITGQSVPASAGVVWTSVAATPIQLEPPRPQEWFEYGEPHRPGLTLEQVEIACQLASNKASLLAQLLGPVA